MTTISANTTFGVKLSPAFVTNPLVIGSGVTVTNPSYPFSIYTPPSSTATFTIQNNGTVNGVSDGVYLTPGGSVANGTSASITGQIGITIAGGGLVTNAVSASIIGITDSVYISGDAGDVINAGNIGSGASVNGKAVVGVILNAGGSVTNAAGASITGFSNGVAISGSIGSVFNYGDIGGGVGVALESGGTVANGISASIHGVAFLFGGGPGTLVNDGIINRSGGGSKYTRADYNVRLAEGGSVINQASGSIISQDADYDVFIPGTGTVVNYGVIADSWPVNLSPSYGSGVYLGTGSVTNATSASITGVLYGVDLTAGGTLTNAGTITGSDGPAVAFGGTGSNLLVLEPGFAFSGVVSGGTSASNTLELASTTSIGTVTGLGAQFLHFGSIVFDPGAEWSISGLQRGLAGTISGFAAGDTIVLDGITATASSFADGVLTLTGPSGGGTLDVPGSFTTSSFVVTNVAAGAQVNVLPIQNQSRTLSWTGDGTSTALGTMANWDDVTNALNPAQTAPTSKDTVEFNTSGGAVSGIETVAAVAVGSIGDGSLQLTSGATLVAGSLDAGVVASAIGEISLTGIGADLSVTGPATVGDDGTGVLAVLGGATFSAASLIIGNAGDTTDSSGAAVVSGSGSNVQLSGALNVGTSLGTGDLTVGPGASVNASVVNLQGQEVLEGGLVDPTVQLINQGQTAGGFGTIAAGDIVDEGAIQAGGNKSSQKLLIVQGTVLGGGTLTVNGTLPGSVPAGILQINAGGTLELSGAVLNAPTNTFTDNLTPTGTYTVTNSVIDVNFVDSAGVLLLDDIAGFDGTITAYQAGDRFVIAGGTLTGLGVNNGNTLTVQDSGSKAGAGGVDKITFASGINSDGFAIVNNNTVQVACLAEGTRVETKCGPVAVEALAVGDEVRTLLGGPGRIEWLGRRAIDCTRHPNPEAVWPVRIARGAFGDNAPTQDLCVSPEHAIFVDGVLVPARLLVNGTTIRQVKVRRVAYYHIELPHHDVLLAEGLPVESYLDTGGRSNFENSGMPIALHPDFSARMWEAMGCAPLVVTGPILAAVRAWLLRRAAKLAVETDRRRPTLQRYRAR